MPQTETQPIQFDFFDGTECESLEAKERELAGILEEAFERVREKLNKDAKSTPGGFIIQQCEHCGCPELDVWGFCKQCGRNPQILYSS